MSPKPAGQTCSDQKNRLRCSDDMGSAKSAPLRAQREPVFGMCDGLGLLIAPTN